jgi:ribosomal protein S18 acetylase RimI-like enzyme
MSIPSLQPYLVEDEWLASLFKRKVYRLKVERDLIEAPASVLRDLRETLRQGKVFCYAKVGTGDLSGIHFLESLRFNLIEANVTLKKKTGMPAGPAQELDVRFAHDQDREGVKGLAARNFIYSRFHMDPLISLDLANEVKACWAENFFFKKRGDSMVVAYTGSSLAGFLQLLFSGQDLVIDLIAVEEKFRRMGIAGAMVRFAETALRGFEATAVGTQIANVPSLRLYEGLGFRVSSSAYTFHYHHFA